MHLRTPALWSLPSRKPAAPKHWPTALEGSQGRSDRAGRFGCHLPVKEETGKTGWLDHGETNHL